MNVDVIIPSRRDDGDWRDLAVCVASINAYRPADVGLVIAWAGPPPPKELRHVKQPDDVDSWGAAVEFARSQSDADVVIVTGDDTVFCPDSIETLIREYQQLPDVGWLGTRSNYAKGPQNIRNPNGARSCGVQFDTESQVLEVSMVVPTPGMVSQAALDEVGGIPSGNWFADDLVCWRMKRKGYRHFVSTAYVHHVGQRSTGPSDDLLATGLAWLAEEDPEFYQEVTGASHTD